MEKYKSGDLVEILIGHEITQVENGISKVIEIRPEFIGKRAVIEYSYHTKYGENGGTKDSYSIIFEDLSNAVSWFSLKQIKFIESDRHDIIEKYYTKKNIPIMDNELIDPKILDKAIATWGENAQIEMIIEECSELILALQKIKRRPHMSNEKAAEATLNVHEEIADVEIMIKQAKKIFNKEIVESFTVAKMKRLKMRLDKKIF